MDVSAYSWYGRIMYGSGILVKNTWGLSPGLDQNGHAFAEKNGALLYWFMASAGIWSSTVSTGTFASAGTPYGTAYLQGVGEPMSVLKKYWMDNYANIGGQRHIVVWKEAVPTWSQAIYMNSQLPPSIWSGWWVNWTTEEDGYSAGSALYSMTSMARDNAVPWITRSGKYIALIVGESWSRVGGAEDVPPTIMGYALYAWSGQ